MAGRERSYIPSMHMLTRKVREEAMALGFDRIAYTAAGPCRDAHRLEKWLAEGRHGEMHWMVRSKDVRADPRQLLPDARTVISLLTFYHASPPPGRESWVGRVSRYAWGRDYHNVLGRRLRKLARTVRGLREGAEAVCAVDAKPILEKEWAERGGLGWIGKHSNLITRDRGSWFFLSELVTNLELAPSHPSDATSDASSVSGGPANAIGIEPGARDGTARDPCGSCTACLDACPTGAIVAPRVVDARRCISYLTIEFRGVLPLDLRPLLGEWIFGCDVCQDVCPWNRFAVPAREDAFLFDERRFRGELEAFLTLDEPTFASRFEGSPVRRAGRDAFVRNVCVALGNRRDPSALPALQGALVDVAPLVRRHAAWAVGRIGSPRATGLLTERLATEPDPDVRGEIEAALSSRDPA